MARSLHFAGCKDGIETTKAIRSRELGTGVHTPILALSAHAMKGDRERFLEAGMDAYVAKPVQPSDLYAAIDALISRAAVRTATGRVMLAAGGRHGDARVI